jgi:hypothetical protein
VLRLLRNKGEWKRVRWDSDADVKKGEPTSYPCLYESVTSSSGLYGTYTTQFVFFDVSDAKTLLAEAGGESS